MKVVISSGKGGTGKTLIATNLASLISNKVKKVTFIDCDVEEPDSHLFLKPDIKETKKIFTKMPMDVNYDKCSFCKKCVEACTYNAIAVVKNKVLIFPDLCHACFACKIICPEHAVIVEDKEIGELKLGQCGNINFYYGLLRIGEAGSTPRLISQLKKAAVYEDITILDTPPGTACPTVEAVKDCDLCVLIADPTPFGINDLKLSVDMCREVGIEPLIFINRRGLAENNLLEYCHTEELEIIGSLPDDRKIAESYSRAEIISETLPQYKNNFEELFNNLKLKLKKPPTLKQKRKRTIERIQKVPEKELIKGTNRIFKELVIISGKGGTGKTSLAGCFAVLAKNKVISDCDVDAADLHLILKPEILYSDIFSSGVDVDIDQEKCIQCGKCAEECRFNAVELTLEGTYYIPPIECEGCGVCKLVCPVDAIITKPSDNGIWYISKTRAGLMTHAKLFAAEENTGRLVTFIRKKAVEISSPNDKLIIIDGSPGTGCPVIASISGADYALIVTEPTPSGLYDLKRVVKVAAHFGTPVGIIINKYDLNLNIVQEIEQLAEQNNIDLIGNIPYSIEFTKAQMKQMTLVEYSQGKLIKEIEKIWENVLSNLMK